MAGASPSSAVVVSKVGLDSGHEGLDVRLAVVPRDRGVYVEPDALDRVVVRAVGRQEVQHNLAVELRQRPLRLLAYHPIVANGASRVARASARIRDPPSVSPCELCESIGFQVFREPA